MSDQRQPEHPIGALAITLIYMGIIVVSWLLVYLLGVVGGR